MTTTAAIIIPAATIVPIVTASPASDQPRKTATTGLTYAYVETFAAVVTRSNQMYAVNATSEPKNIKYATERLERRDTLAGLKPAHSFEITLATKNIALPMSICIAVESWEDLGKGALLE